MSSFSGPNCVHHFSFGCPDYGDDFIRFFRCTLVGNIHIMTVRCGIDLNRSTPGLNFRHRTGNQIVSLKQQQQAGFVFLLAVMDAVIMMKVKTNTKAMILAKILLFIF
jgi:hypothetical protein